MDPTEPKLDAQALQHFRLSTDKKDDYMRFPSQV
jgi:hypothetical protein